MSFLIDFDVQDAKLKAIETSIDTLAQKATAVSSELQKMANAATKDASAVTQLKKSETEAASATQKLKDQVKSTEKPLNDQAKASRRAAQEAAALRAALNAVGTHMGIFTGQTILVASAVYGVVSAFKSMITIGVGFTGEMARALPIMGATGEEAAKLSAEVRRLGETTIFTGQEAAGGLTALAMSGMSATQALSALAPALNLATIGQIDMYRSADILTNVMFGFRMSADDTVKIVDDLATAITSSNATIEQMAGALSYVAPIASAVGASIEETTAILEVFHNVGIKGSRAGTALRRAYVNLLKPSTEAAERLSQLGIKTQDVNGDMLEMTDIMGQLARASATTADVVALFGVRAAPAMQTLLDDMKSVNPEVERLRKGLENNTGAAEDLRKAFEKTVGADAKKLLAAFEEKAIQVFKKIEPELRKLLQSAAEFVKNFDPSTIASATQSLISLAYSIGEVSDALLIMGKAVLVYKGVQLLGGFLGFAGGQGLLAAAGMTSFSVASVTAAGAVAALSVAIKGLMVATGVGIAVLVGVELVQGLYDLATANDRAAESAQRLAKAEMDKNKAMQPKAVSVLEAAGSFDDKKLGKFETLRVKAFQDLESLKRSLDVARQMMSSVELSNDTYAIEFAKNVVSDLEEKVKTSSATFDAATSVVKTYFETGFTPSGIQNAERFAATIAKITSLTLSDNVSSELRKLTSSLNEIKFDEKAGFSSVEQAYKDKIEAISKTEDALRSLATAEKESLAGDYSKAEANSARQVEIAREMTEVNKELEQALQGTTAARLKARDVLTGGSEVKDLLVSSQQYLEKLREENSLLEEGRKGKIDSTAWRLKSASGVLGQRIQLAELNGVRKAEIDVLKLQQVQLKSQAASIREVVDDNKKLIEQQTVQEKLKKDFESGKFLSTDDRAQKEYDQNLAQLESYRQFYDTKEEYDQAYASGKMELDQKLAMSQNEALYAMGESVAKTIGSNVASVTLLDQTWEESSKNIKRAILGGIVGGLAEAASQYLINLALDAMLTTATVTNNEIKANSTVVGASKEVAAKNAVISANITEGITAQSGGDPYTAFFRIAAMTALMAGIQGVVGGIMGGISGTREIGGPVSSGQSYLVGERGAEIFTPTTSGAITSNADAKRSLNSNKSNGSQEVEQTIVNNYYYIDAIDTESFDQRLAKSGGTINQINNKENARRGIRTGRR